MKNENIQIKLSIEKLKDLKGKWPKRSLSYEELVDVYKKHYSVAFRKEYLFFLGAMEKKFGEQIYPIIEETSYELGKQDGEVERAHFKSLLEKIVDISTRPDSYDIEHMETTEEKIVYKVKKCPFADLAKEMGYVRLARYICPRWHEAYAKAYGFKFFLKTFILEGDDCCLQVWQKLF